MSQYDLSNPHTYEASLKKAFRNYQSGINYYRAKANQFIKMMYQAEDEAVETLYRRYATSVNQQLEQLSPDQLISEEKMMAIMNELAKLAEKMIDSTSGMEFAQFIQTAATRMRTNQNDPKYVQNFSHNIRIKFNQMLASDRLKQEVLRIYNNVLQRDANTAASGATVQSLYGMLRKQLVSNVAFGKNYQLLDKELSGYKRAFHGDIKEELGKQALNLIKEGSAAVVGDISGSSGKQTEIDIVIGQGVATADVKELTQIIDNLQSLNSRTTLSINSLPNTDYFGGQVKSWSMPEKSIPGDRQFRDIGSRVSLRNKYGFDRILSDGEKDYTRGWHHSADIISQNITEFLGASNIFYITNNKFYWTADIINTFKNANYFLTFYYSRKTLPNRKYKFTYPTQGEVAWQKQMYKNLYQLKKRR